jgi:hypothetical protein
VEDPAVLAAEHQEVAAPEPDVDERRRAAVDAREPEGARVAEAERHHGGVRGFLAVLVQPELGPFGVEVDDRRVGIEGDRLGARRAVRLGHRSSRQRVEARRQRLHGRTVGVIGGP